MLEIISAGIAVGLYLFERSIADLEKENRRKERELLAARKKADRDIQCRQEELKRADLLHDVERKIRIYRLAVKSAKESEIDAKKNFLSAKDNVKSLQKQERGAYSDKEQRKKELDAYKKQVIANAKGKYVDFKKDEGFCQRIKDIRALSNFCHLLTGHKRQAAEAKQNFLDCWRDSKKQRDTAYAKLQEFKTKRTRFQCKWCGSYFYLTAGEVAYFQSKGFQLPKRCKTCRADRRALN